MDENITLDGIPLVGRKIHVRKNGFDFWGNIRRVIPEHGIVVVRLEDQGYLSVRPNHVDELTLIA